MCRLIITLVICAFSVQTVLSQTSRYPGMGVSVQYGLNPKADYIKWDMENSEFYSFPSTRYNIAPTLQFNSFDKIRIEVALQYSQSEYKAVEATHPSVHNIKMNEWALPVNLNYNTRSPLKFHSSLIYVLGASVKLQNIPSQHSIGERKSVVMPAINAGLRLSSEIKSYGRFEYGVIYSRNLLNDFSFNTSENQDFPAKIITGQNTGQFNLQLIYFFSPRKYTWSASRYQMDGITGNE